MNIILCDDEPAQVALLHQYVDAYAAEKKISAEVKEYIDCDTLWWDLQDGLSGDLFLLDIEIRRPETALQQDAPGRKDAPAPMSGIALAKKMREEKMPYPVCFVTGIRDYVFEGYDVDAIGYILKPYEKEQVFRILDKASAMLLRPKRYVFLQAEGERVRVDADIIVAIEAAAHDTLVHLKEDAPDGGKTLKVKQGFQSVLAFLQEAVSEAGGNASSFLTQIHRSYAVNMRNIQRVTKDACIGEGGLSFPVARGSRDAVMQAFIAANKAGEAG
ncbi:MAG: response regulator transcription factor [Lachnospiraceae bacterium]|nr:response regulator transcription factor [Lachnospiraceae bacterium]